MFQKHMFANVHNKTWMSQQNNKKTSNQGLFPVVPQYKFQEPQKLQKKDHSENWTMWITNIELEMISEGVKRYAVYVQSSLNYLW